MILKFLAGKGEGAMMDEASFFENSQFTREEFELAVQNLLQRELIEQVNSQNYRFQVELIRRWFNQ